MANSRDPRHMYEKIKALQAGAEGAMNCGIYLVRRRDTKQKCIEKRVPIQDIQSGHAMREVKAMKLTKNHPNIIDIYAHSLDYHSYGYGSVYMQYCELGSLDSLINTFYNYQSEIPEGFLWKVLFDMANALCYLQRGVLSKKKAREGQAIGKKEKAPGWLGIAHRDIKPANIFITWKRDQDKSYPTVVLADFGCSVALDDMRSRNMSAWTRAFQPPEAPRYSDSSDIYSLALVIYCLALVRPGPFKDASMVRSRPLGAANFSRALEKLLKRCLSREYKDRPDAAYLPYLVWREMDGAIAEVGREGFRAMPEWAFQ